MAFDENTDIQLKNGILDPKHVQQMGMAIWLYVWCLENQSNEQGWVMGGKPVDLAIPAKEVGKPKETVRNWGQRLKGHYLDWTPVPGHGVRIRVLNPQKRFQPKTEGPVPTVPAKLTRTWDDTCAVLAEYGHLELKRYAARGFFVRYMGLANELMGLGERKLRYAGWRFKEHKAEKISSGNEGYIPKNPEKVVSWLLEAADRCPDDWRPRGESTPSQEDQACIQALCAKLDELEAKLPAAGFRERKQIENAIRAINEELDELMP